jgi:putative oxidoreductase
MENIQTTAFATASSGTATKFLPLIARILLALPFIPSGVGKIFDFDGTAKMMASEGMPLVSLFLVGAIVLEIFGGLSLLLGFKARWGALLLVVFLIAATAIFHDVWTFQGTEQQAQLIQFFKNLGLLGGLTAIAAFGAGAYSVDNNLLRRAAGENE